MIEILCNGKIVRGFTSAKIVMGMDTLCASYNFDVFSSDGDKSAWIPIYPGDEVQVVVDGETILTGYNDTTSPSYTNSGLRCSVEGREKTCDIVDCVPQRLDYEHKKVDEIVRSICAEFDIPFVCNDVDVGAPMEKFCLSPSATAFDAIRSACAERRLIVRSDGNGNVSIDNGKYMNAAVDLVQGKNVISAAGKFSVRGRFSNYKVYASRDAKGKTFAEVEDEEIKRTRNWMMLDDKFATSDDCEKRAMWEAKHRQALSGSLGVVVSGWRQMTGAPLWKPGVIVNCDIPLILGEQRQFLVNRVMFGYGSDGATTSLELVDVDVYSPLPTFAPKKKAVKQKSDVWASVRKQTGSKLR